MENGEWAYNLMLLKPLTCQLNFVLSLSFNSKMQIGIKKLIVGLIGRLIEIDRINYEISLCILQ